MPGNLSELVQMIATLSNVQAQKRQLDLKSQELQQGAEQFASQGEERNFANAIKLIAGSSAKTREGLDSLVGTLSPEHQSAARAFLQGQPIDPTVMHAEDIQRGHGALTPQMLAAVQQEAATQNATGLNVGQLGQSQLGGTLAAGAIPQVTPQMQAAYAERAATGRDPATAAVQDAQIQGGMIPAIAQIAGGLRQNANNAAQVNLGYANNNLGYAQLDTEERKWTAYYGLDKILKTAEAMKYAGQGTGQLTGSDWLDAVKAMPSILNDVNKNTSDKAGNMARLRVFNRLAIVTGQPELVVPLTGEDAPSKVGIPTELKRSILGGPKLSDYTGAQGGTMPWPSMTPTLGGPQ